MSRPRALPSWSFRLVQRGIHASARFTRPMTLGVRGLVLDEEERVFLVRHSYVAGWHLPGGAVEPGESADAALARELAEEGNIMLDGPAVPIALYFNRRLSRRDHVALYLVRSFRQTAPRPADWEIVESGFFPRRSLPAHTTAATRARLAEVLDGAPRSEDW